MHQLFFTIHLVFPGQIPAPLSTCVSDSYPPFEWFCFGLAWFDGAGARQTLNFATPYTSLLDIRKAVHLRAANGMFSLPPPPPPPLHPYHFNLHFGGKCDLSVTTYSRRSKKVNSWSKPYMDNLCHAQILVKAVYHSSPCWRAEALCSLVLLMARTPVLPPAMWHMTEVPRWRYVFVELGQHCQQYKTYGLGTPAIVENNLDLLTHSGSRGTDTVELGRPVDRDRCYNFGNTVTGGRYSSATHCVSQLKGLCDVAMTVHDLESLNTAFH